MCDAPIPIRYNPPLLDGKGGFIYSFPADCGKCLPCLKKRKQQWSYRLTEQMRDSFSAYFVTLTYDEISVPWSDGVMSANEWDHKQFIKELKFLEQPKILKRRTAVSLEEYQRGEKGISTTEIYLKDDGTEGVRRKPLLYYGVIEYGDLTSRPHYHYILFNIVDKDNIVEAWKGKGRVQIDECNVNTIDYVLKYMIKDPAEKKYENKVPEKSFMSKGLGRFALNGELVKYVRQPEGNMLLNTRNSKVAVPRYYRKKYLTEDEAKQKALYIASITEEKDKEDEQMAQIYGYDLGLKKTKEKEVRYKSLKKRQFRKN